MAPEELYRIGSGFSGALLRELTTHKHWTKCYVQYTHLRSIQTDDSIHIPGTVEEVGDCDSMFTGGNPILLGAGVDLEDVGPCTEDGLLSVQRKEKKQKGKEGEMEQSVSG